MESGWIENQQEYLTSCAQFMMQSEIDKFKGIVQLIHDYYHAIEEKVIPEAPEQFTVDLGKEEGDIPEIERLNEGADSNDLTQYSFPRLDDLYKKALKAQTVPEIAAQAAAGGADPKKAAAKGGKDAKKGGAAEEEQTRPESEYVKEMREAIKVEKSNLRFRLT